MRSSTLGCGATAEIESVISRLRGIPVDITPVFAAAAPSGPADRRRELDYAEDGESGTFRRLCLPEPEAEGDEEDSLSRSRH